MATADPPAAITSRPPALWPPNRRHALIAAWLLWIVPMLVIAALTIHNPFRHTVTIDSYNESAKNWLAGKGLFAKGPSGMNYLPQFAVLYIPFHILPFTLSEILWRFCAAATLAGGLWRLARELFGAESERVFLWATITAMPLSLAALRNGNANAVFGGVTLLAIVAILQQRWWPAVAWMILATALKPLGIVLLLLAAIYYVPVARRLPAALFGLAVFPFFFASPGYVAAQYQGAWNNLRACGAVTENRFADLNGVLRTFKAPLSPGASTFLRVLSGGLTALAWRWGARRLNPAVRGLWLYALTTAYLMLFNPMNEENSYVILAPALGAWGAYFLFSAEAGGRRLGWGIVFMALSMVLLPNVLRPLAGHDFGNHFALCWFPCMALLFLAALLHFVSRGGGGALCPQSAARL